MDECGKQALQGVTEVKRTIAVHTTEIKALEKAAGTLESMTVASQGDATMAVRLAGTNLSHHQERQLADSQLCIVLKGVPQALTEGREKYRDMAVAFSRAMGEIKLGGDIQPKLLQRISKRKEDRSGRPPTSEWNSSHWGTRSSFLTMSGSSKSPTALPLASQLHQTSPNMH